MFVLMLLVDHEILLCQLDSTYLVRATASGLNRTFSIDVNMFEYLYLYLISVHQNDMWYSSRICSWSNPFSNLQW